MAVDDQGSSILASLRSPGRILPSGSSALARKFMPEPASSSPILAALDAAWILPSTVITKVVVKPKNSSKPNQLQAAMSRAWTFESPSPTLSKSFFWHKKRSPAHRKFGIG